MDCRTRRLLKADNSVFLYDINNTNRTQRKREKLELDFSYSNVNATLLPTAKSTHLPNPILQMSDALPTVYTSKIPVFFRKNEPVEKRQRTADCFKSVLKIVQSEYIENCQAIYPNYNIHGVCLLVVHGNVEYVRRCLKEKLDDKSMIDEVKFVETDEFIEELQTGNCAPGSGILATRQSFEQEIQTYCIGGLITKDDLLAATQRVVKLSTIAGYARDEEDNQYMLTVAHSHIKEWKPSNGVDTAVLNYVVDTSKPNPPFVNTHLFLFTPQGQSHWYKRLASTHTSLFGTYMLDGQSVIADICAIKIPNDIKSDLRMCFVNQGQDMSMSESIVNTFPHNAQVFGAMSGCTHMTLHAGDIHILQKHSCSLGPLYASRLLEQDDSTSSPSPGNGPDGNCLRGGDSGCSFVNIWNTSESDIVEVYSMHRSMAPRNKLELNKTEITLPMKPWFSLSYPIGNQLNVLKRYGNLNLELIPLYTPNIPGFL